MYVKYIILDGFKSYRDITRIGPFDPHFNAITGLNGSGKSNVLDGICFVLGISAMSVVRCKNLADCIYVGGGESVNKASVSIVLDNSDKRKCPPGQEDYKEVIVSRTVHKNGECKYYINKTTATKRQVTDLFESVQLNVNNPNFMIMQGKITKVVNMKPKELLHMIEETVGATLYQAKKEKAENELRNKQTTIDSINGVLLDHIKPTLEKQTKANEMIQEYNIQTREQNERQIEYAIAHFLEVKESGRKADEKLKRVLEQDKSDDQRIEQCNRDIITLKQQQEKMKKESNSKFKEKIEQTEKALSIENKKLHTKEADIKSASEALQNATKAVKEAERTKKNEEKQVTDFKNKSAKAIAEFAALKDEMDRATAELEKAQEQENQLRSGKILDDEGKTVDLEQELNAVSTEAAALKPDVDDIQKIMAEYKAKLGHLSQQLKNTPSDAQVEKDYSEAQKIFENIKREAAQRNINAEESVGELHNNLEGCMKRRDALGRDRASITNRNYHLSFSFDKTKVSPQGVYGCVYDYVKVNGVEQWGNALEMVVSGFMGHIVVENDTIGKNLVKIGQMTRRTMVHPLNTFRSSYSPSRVTQRELDNQLGVGNAIFALDLLEYDNKFRPLVEHFVGGKVLCKDMNAARHVAFKLHLKAYTISGDTCDPGGVMQGGTRNNLGGTIRDITNLYSINQELKALSQSITTLNDKLQTAKNNEQFIARLEKAKRELHNADQMRKLTKYSQLKQEMETITAKRDEDGTQLQEKQEKLKKLIQVQTSLQKKVDQQDSIREKMIRDTANGIKKWQKAFETAKNKIDSKKKYFEDIDMDIKSKEEFLNGCQKDIDDAIAAKNECSENLEKLRDEMQLFQEHFAEYQQAYDAAVRESMEWMEEAKRVQDDIKAKDAEIEAAELNKMKRNNNRDAFQEEFNWCLHEAEKLKEKFQDINFGNVSRTPGGKSATALKKDLDFIGKKLEDMKQRLDYDAAASLQATRTCFTSSSDKLTMIERNKKNLVKAIHTLDESKKQKVRAAYDDVNSKFNSMMSTLLPEARARLVEVVPGDLAQGVNIHVQLGGVWKESLTELSGGQRSLVALSLVLSLCMYNPAPFYILDEVDAALDLSHTQNIGVVIQRQFKGTQFICVSLKDGMFSNANVLFTAKHEQGRSVVHRSAKNNDIRSMPPPNNEEYRRKTKNR